MIETPFPPQTAGAAEILFAQPIDAAPGISGIAPSVIAAVAATSAVCWASLAHIAGLV